MRRKILPELGILALQSKVVIRNKHPCDDTTNESKRSTNQENSLSTLELVRERILDRREDLSANSRSSLTDSCREAKEVATQWSWEGFGTTEERCDLFVEISLLWFYRILFVRVLRREFTYTRTHFTEGVEDAIQDNEERQDKLDLPKSTTGYKTQKSPEAETQSHSLLTADFIHKKTTDEAAWKVETIYNSTIANVLDERIVRVELADDSRTEETKGIRLLLSVTDAIGAKDNIKEAQGL